VRFGKSTELSFSSRKNGKNQGENPERFSLLSIASYQALLTGEGLFLSRLVHKPMKGSYSLITQTTKQIYKEHKESRKHDLTKEINLPYLT
jgi:hypothetical protein